MRRIANEGRFNGVWRVLFERVERPGLTVERREKGVIHEPLPHVFISVGPDASARDAFLAALPGILSSEVTA